MEFSDLVDARYSVRKFSDMPVEREKLELILRAGRLAPTACNNQPQRIAVIAGAEARAKLRDCTAYHFGAPVALLVCCDREASWIRPFDGDNSGVVDAAIAATHMMLQAADLGLGTTWVGHFDPAKTAAAFGLPATWTPVALLPLGYPAAGSAPHPLHQKKLPPEAVVFHDRVMAGK